ncbi:MAG: cyanase, partial [Achromobacter mucicolens]
MSRAEVTELVVTRKLEKKLSWGAIAEAVGQSKEWTTAALLGQMTMTEEQAQAAARVLDLPTDAVVQLQVVPYKGSLPSTVPTDPL